MFDCMPTVATSYSALSALLEQQRHAVALGDRQLGDSGPSIASSGRPRRSDAAALLATFPRRHLDVIAAREQQQFLRNARPADRVARHRRHGAQVDVRVPKGKRHRQSVIDIRSDVRIEDQRNSHVTSVSARVRRRSGTRAELS